MTIQLELEFLERPCKPLKLTGRSEDLRAKCQWVVHGLGRVGISTNFADWRYPQAVGFLPMLARVV